MNERISRRAQAEMIEWFPRILLIIVATVVIVMLVSFYSNRSIDSADVELSSVFYRVYYDSIIMYSDQDTGRVYPGVIDNDLFKDERLTSVFTKKSELTGESRVGICITLIEGKQDARTTRTICSDKGMVDRYLPMAQTGMGGGQGAKMFNITMPVTVRDKTSQHAAIMNAIVVRSNS